MNKADRASLDKKILSYVKIKGTVNVNRVARSLNVKWETAERSLKRLMAKGHVFYHPDIKLWSIWADYHLTQCIEDGQHEEKRELSSENDVLYARFIPNLKSTVRGEVGQTVETEGFVCHPRTRPHEVSRNFVRGHIHGHYSVEIVEAGRMPTTYADSDLGYHGKWYSKDLNGNIGYYGELTLPDDPIQFKFHALSFKDGSLKKLAVYVHPRYIYVKGNRDTAMSEFRLQVRDVLNVLERYGWRFGNVELKGIYSMGINDRILAANVPVNHAESDADIVHYDSSPGHEDGVCTEAEIYDDHPGAEAEANVMAELPKRILTLESKMSGIDGRISKVENRLVDVTRLLEANVSNTDRLVSSVEGISRLTELNTAVLLGDRHVPIEDPSYIAGDKKEDVMYG